MKLSFNRGDLDLGLKLVDVIFKFLKPNRFVYNDKIQYLNY